MSDFFPVARDTALKAGGMLKDELYGARQIGYKGDINLVTEMDKRSERAIVDALHAAFPGHGIVAEEETTIRSESAYTWVIDPLDGTTNYAHGYPCFSVSIALLQHGSPILGLVYDPMRDELFWAEKKQGAFLNGKRISVSVVHTLIQSLLATGFPYDRKVSEENNMTYFHDLLMASQEVRRDGSAALDLCSVASGRFDGFWELKLKPWDVAAGSLIVAEAGGKVTNLDGSTFDMQGEEILASNGLIHQLMVDAFRRSKKDPDGGACSAK